MADPNLNLDPSKEIDLGKTFKKFTLAGIGIGIDLVAINQLNRAITLDENIVEKVQHGVNGIGLTAVALYVGSKAFTKNR